MHIRSHTLVSAAVAAAVVAALSGCVPAADPDTDPASRGEEAAPAPTASATPSGSSTPDGAATPAPVMADAASLLIGPTSFTLVDDSGAELGTWDYRDGTGAVDALTEAFGSAPTESDDVPYEGYRSRASTWPGFAFKDTEVYDAGGPEQKYPEPDFLLEATAATVGEVAVSTLGGVSVGDDALEVRAEHPEGGEVPGLFTFDETTVGALDGVDLTNAVMAVAEDESSVSILRAPAMNWGV